MDPTHAPLLWPHGHLQSGRLPMIAKSRASREGMQVIRKRGFVEANVMDGIGRPQSGKRENVSEQVAHNWQLRKVTRRPPEPWLVRVGPNLGWFRVGKEPSTPQQTARIRTSP